MKYSKVPSLTSSDPHSLPCHLAARHSFFVLKQSKQRYKRAHIRTQCANKNCLGQIHRIFVKMAFYPLSLESRGHVPQAREGHGSPRCSASRSPLGSEARSRHHKPQMPTLAFLFSPKPVARIGKYSAMVVCRRNQEKALPFPCLLRPLGRSPVVSL